MDKIETTAEAISNLVMIKDYTDKIISDYNDQVSSIITSSETTLDIMQRLEKYFEDSLVVDLD